MFVWHKAPKVVPTSNAASRDTFDPVAVARPTILNPNPDAVPVNTPAIGAFIWHDDESDPDKAAATAVPAHDDETVNTPAIESFIWHTDSPPVQMEIDDTPIPEPGMALTSLLSVLSSDLFSEAVCSGRPFGLFLRDLTQPQLILISTSTFSPHSR